MIPYQTVRGKSLSFRFVIRKTVLSFCTAVLLLGGHARANLVITPVWDSTITNDVNASLITNTILQAITVYQSSFSDNVTVYINFQEMGSGLGQSSISYYIISYPTYRGQLLAHRTTSYDTNAVSRLPNSSFNPVNGSTSVNVNIPNCRSLGLNSDGFGNSIDVSSAATNVDGIVYLNTSIMNLSRATTNGSKYDLLAVAEHEINEVLGLVSALDGLPNGNAAPTGGIGPMDFYRYDQNGSRSFDTGINTQAYFSLDGTNKLVRYNQDGSGGADYHDFYSKNVVHTPRVQDAFATAGATPSMNVELIALDVIGYNFLVPKMSITKVSTNKESISWSPATPGFILQENTNLLSTNWLNSVNGTNNPTTVTNTTTLKFFRLTHP